MTFVADFESRAIKFPHKRLNLIISSKASLPKGKSPFIQERRSSSEAQIMEEAKEPEAAREIRDRGYSFGDFSYSTDNF